MKINIAFGHYIFIIYLLAQDLGSRSRICNLIRVSYLESLSVKSIVKL